MASMNYYCNYLYVRLLVITNIVTSIIITTITIILLWLTVILYYYYHHYCYYYYYYYYSRAGLFSMPGPGGARRKIPFDISNKNPKP